MLQVYLVPEGGSSLPAMLPKLPDGSSDTAAMARLKPRHDDWSENVSNRLAKWEAHVLDVRAAFGNVSIRVQAGESLEDILAKIEGFVMTEDHIESIGIVDSTSLADVQYEIVHVLRFQRHQLAKVAASDGSTHWVALEDLAANTQCMLLHQDPANYSSFACLARADTVSIYRPKLISISTDEPIRLLCSLFMGPQQELVMDEDPPKKV